MKTPEETQAEQGIFIPAGELPPHLWKKFFLICQANGLNPREQIVKLILKEITDFNSLKKPVLDQLLNKSLELINKKILYSNQKTGKIF